MPSSLSCPKCGAALLDRVVSRVCSKSLKDPNNPKQQPTCDFYMRTAAPKARPTAGVTSAINGELVKLFNFHGIFRRDMQYWRITPRVPGEIHGLPGSFGTLVATNGVLCLIEQETGDERQAKLFEGHIDSFEPFKSDDLDTVVELSKSVAAAKRKVRRIVEDYAKLVEESGE